MLSLFHAWVLFTVCTIFVFVQVALPLYGQSPFPFIPLNRTTTSPIDCESIEIDDIRSNISGSRLGEWYSTHRPASNAVDGDALTKWTSRGNGSWITLELEEQQPICGIGIQWFDGTKRIYDFSLAFSNNTQDFTDKIKLRSTGTLNSTEFYETPPIEAKSIMLTVNGSSRNSYAHINELEVDSQILGSLFR